MTDQTVGGVDAGGTSTPLPSIIPEAMAKDLVAAWAELSNVHRSKTANAGTYSYAYADLGDLLDVARPILAAHNLALIQPLMRMDSVVITVETMLIHSSGHYLLWFFDVSAGATAQATGSGITYARRYSALGALGVAAGGDDDDGAKASAAPHVPELFDDAQPGPSAVQTKRVVHLFDTLDIVLQKERREVMAAILDAPERTWAELRPDERLTVITALAERVEEQERQTAGVASGLFDE